MRRSRRIFGVFVTGLKGMNRQLRGRPRLPLTVQQVLEAVRRRGTVTAAGLELSCSPAYIYARFNKLGLTLAQALDAPSIDELLRSGALEDEHDTNR